MDYRLNWAKQEREKNGVGVGIRRSSQEAEGTKCLDYIVKSSQAAGLESSE